MVLHGRLDECVEGGKSDCMKSGVKTSSVWQEHYILKTNLELPYRQHAIVRLSPFGMYEVRNSF